MELEWAVHQGRMLKALPALQLPREVGVKAFVVAHHSRLKVIETSEERQPNEQGVEDRFRIHSDAKIQNAFEDSFTSLVRRL